MAAAVRCAGVDTDADTGLVREPGDTSVDGDDVATGFPAAAASLMAGTGESLVEMEDALLHPPPHNTVNNACNRKRTTASQLFRRNTEASADTPQKSARHGHKPIAPEL